MATLPGKGDVVFYMCGFIPLWIACGELVENLWITSLRFGEACRNERLFEEESYIQ